MIKSNRRWKIFKILSGPSPIFALSFYTTVSQTQTGATVPLKTEKMNTIYIFEISKKKYVLHQKKVLKIFQFIFFTVYRVRGAEICRNVTLVGEYSSTVKNE